MDSDALVPLIVVGDYFGAMYVLWLMVGRKFGKVEEHSCVRCGVALEENQGYMFNKQTFCWACSIRVYSMAKKLFIVHTVMMLIFFIVLIKYMLDWLSDGITLWDCVYCAFSVYIIVTGVMSQLNRKRDLDGFNPDTEKMERD